MDSIIRLFPLFIFRSERRWGDGNNLVGFLSQNEARMSYQIQYADDLMFKRVTSQNQGQNKSTVTICWFSWRKEDEAMGPSSLDYSYKTRKNDLSNVARARFHVQKWATIYWWE